MSFNEKQVFEALAQAPFTVTLGGKEFKFYPMSLSDMQELSVITADIPSLVKPDNEEEAFKEAVHCGKYARQVAEIITAGAHIRGRETLRIKVLGIPVPVRVISEKARKKRLFRYAYRIATVSEIYRALVAVLVRANPAFFLEIIISLSRKNTLKPTKETEATALGQ